MLNLFPQTAKINKDHLTIGGCDTVALAKEFGLKGAAFFKADGFLDPMTWEVMK